MSDIMIAILAGIGAAHVVVYTIWCSLFLGVKIAEKIVNRAEFMKWFALYLKSKRGAQ